MPLELTTIRRRRRLLTEVPAAPPPDNDCLRYSTDRLRSETRSKAGCFDSSGSHPLNRTHFPLVNFSLMLLWPCVILRQPDTHTHSLKALTTTADTRNRFRIRGSIRPEKKHEKKKFSHFTLKGRASATPTNRSSGPGTHALTRTRTHALAGSSCSYSGGKKVLGIPDFPPDDDSVPQ